MRVERCDFSGYRIYPSKGKTYVRGDSKVGLMFMSGSGVGWSGWAGKRNKRCQDGYKDGKEDGPGYAGEGMKWMFGRMENQRSRRLSRMETNVTDFPIRQLQGRISLPTEEEPPKDRMDPGLQEVRLNISGERIIADLCLFFRHRHLTTHYVLLHVLLLGSLLLA